MRKVLEIVARLSANTVLPPSSAVAVLAAIGEGIIGTDAEGRVRFVNPAAERMTGYTASELHGQSFHDRLHHSRPDGTPIPSADCRAFHALQEGEAVVRGDTVYWRKDGTAFPVEGTLTPILDNGVVTGAVIAFRDMTERLRVADLLQRQAHYDDLTGLANRTTLHERLDESIATATAERQCFALLVLDVDAFKDINDTFGHEWGDDLLREVADRLARLAHQEGHGRGLVARLGGDEFALLLPNAAAPAALRVAHQARLALAESFAVNGYDVDVQASVGVSLFPNHGDDGVALLRRADVAMYVAKRNGRGVFMYDAEKDVHSPARLALASDLRRALERNSLSLHYQPKVALGSGSPVGFEALARWPHAERGWISPDSFIPLAEQTGLIRPLSRWALDNALEQAAGWARAGSNVSVAVNLSPSDLDEQNLPRRVARLLALHGVPAQRLALEITESSLMRDPDRALSVLAQLRDMGVRIEVDDFGTGYSSLAYLKRLPAHALKIDRSFVRDMAHDRDDATIVRSTIHLAHDLGLEVVAEGVEDRQTWELLTEYGCDQAQGYLLSRPLAAPDATDWLARTEEDRYSWRLSPERTALIRSSSSNGLCR